MKALLTAALLTATTAYAGDWTFTLANLRGDGIFGTTEDLFSVSGSFTATDLNEDGAITTDEVTSLYVWDSHQAFPFHLVGMDETPRPYSTGSMRLRLNIASGQVEDLDAWSFDGATRYGMSLVDGAYVCSYICYGARYEQTSTALAIQAVPEPGAWGLLALGLITLSAAEWRRSARGSAS